MEEKISVIVVTYNRLDYLKLTVEAILQQTYRNIEVVVIGDGHQADVEEYINNHEDQRISYLFVDHCGYPAKGRNLGIKNTNGPLIAFCDDDDVWLPNKLAKQMDVFKENQGVVLCCTNRVIINSDGEISDKKSLAFLPGEFNLSNLLVSNFVSYSSVVLKRAVLEKTGLFPDEMKFKAIEDYHLWIRVAYFGEVHFLNEDLVLYRVHNSNITTTFSKGAYRNILLFNDLFSKYKFTLWDKVKAYSVAYSKVILYKVREFKLTH